MKRLFTLLAVLMLVVSASFAQQNFYFWEKNGNVTIEPISQVDSLTFSTGNWLFQISKPVNLGVTTNAFQGSAKVVLSEKVKSIDATPEVGICYSDENTKPTYDDFKKVLGSTMQNYSFTIMNVDPGTTYYYRVYVKLLSNVYYSEAESITTMGEKPQDIVINGHKFVDLGLPSGLLWAETNVGATSATDDGDYFAWGETEQKENFDIGTYKWGRIRSKYNSTDGKKVLDSEDDVATIKWGIDCRIPSKSEFQELRDECIWLWISDYKGTSGYKVTGKNGKSVFFPASGKRYRTLLYNHDPDPNGFYWSRSLRWDDADFACYLEFNSDKICLTYNNGRYLGFSIRPVTEK